MTARCAPLAANWSTPPSATASDINLVRWHCSAVITARVTIRTRACSRRICFGMSLPMCGAIWAMRSLFRFKPGNDVGSVLVGRENRIEHLGDRAVVDDQCHALEQGHSRHGECRKLERLGQHELVVRQNGEGQMQAARRLTLVAGILRRQAVKLIHSQALELVEMITK